MRPLCIKLPQMVGYVKCFDSTMNIKFDSESVYGDNDKYIKAKIK